MSTLKGSQIREARLQAGMTQLDLSLLLKQQGTALSQTSISNIEMGARGLSAENSAAIARALGIGKDAGRPKTESKTDSIALSAEMLHTLSIELAKTLHSQSEPVEELTEFKACVLTYLIAHFPEPRIYRMIQDILRYLDCIEN